MMHQLGDEDCILPSKLQAALQQVLEERELILGQEAEQEGASPGGQSPSWVPCGNESIQRLRRKHFLLSFCGMNVMLCMVC